MRSSFALGLPCFSTALCLSTGLFFSIALGMPFAPRAQTQDAPIRGQVKIVILGRFNGAWLHPVKEELERHLQVQVSVVERPIRLPRSAYYEPRNRYRAGLLTDFLIARFRSEPATTRILGLTSRDISTTAHGHHDWGILGLANDVPGRAAVVSSFRVRRRAPSPEHALWRLTTTAVHEMGHVFGLPHCTEARCLMRDAEGTMDTVDQGDGALGPSCRQLLDREAPRTLAREARNSE